jgi:hypothetical protein
MIVSLISQQALFPQYGSEVFHQLEGQKSSHPQFSLYSRLQKQGKLGMGRFLSFQLMKHFGSVLGKKGLLRYKRNNHIQD